MGHYGLDKGLVLCGSLVVKIFKKNHLITSTLRASSFTRQEVAYGTRQEVRR